MSKKILMYDAKPYDIKFFDAANKDHGYEIKYLKGHLTEETACLAKGYDAVCIFVNDAVTRKTADILYECGVKLIALRSAGYNNVDLESVYKRITVVRVPAYSPYAVAEHAVALMLSLNRNTHRAYYRTRDSNFAISGFLGFDMNGKTAGIIGTGKIGKILAGILKGFGMRVLAYDVYPDEASAGETGYEYVDLNTLYAESDIISLHCPLTGETEHMIDQGSIARMKDGVMLINTGRGKLVDARSLVEGLKSGKIGHAGLDVYEEESEYFFEDFSDSFISDDVLARLLTFHNVLITSHQGFFTREALTNIAGTTFVNIKAFFSGTCLANEVCFKCQQKVCTKKEGQRCF